jgi:hyaluronan synthase
MMLGLIVSIVSLTYITYVYALWISREDKDYGKYNKSFAVVIPCYNEGYDELVKCVSSCIDADGDKKVILVDNNNKQDSNTMKAIRFLNNRYKDLIVLRETRQGKRFAHAKGLEAVDTEVSVFIDSDTILEKNAFTELLKPFNDSSIGAVAGQVTLANKNTNFLTKCISAMFWTSCNIFRKSSASAGYMAVISGAVSAYRTDLLRELEYDYTNQMFLGRPCAISDDRYLTQRVQTRFKKKIAYQENAIGHTFMPDKYINFWKTMERWRRGVLRETFLVWKEPFWNAKLMFFDIQFNFLILTIMVFLKIGFIVNLALHPSWINFLWTAVWFIMIASFYSIIMVVENPKEFKYKLGWSLLYEFFYVFTYFNAWYNIRRQASWVTR